MGKGKTKTNLNAIRAALKALENEGRLNPEAIVAAAADPSSPLHDEFEWSDSVAAAKYRLMQAEQLIRRVKIVVKHERVSLRIPLYISDPGVNGPAMVSLTADTFARADAEASVDSELARLRGNLSRSLGVVLVLDRRHPGLLDDFWMRLMDIVDGLKSRPRRTMTGDEASVGAIAASQ